jgi:predicted ATP-grasp superfamily ATP-dependent carboligase
VERCRLTGLFGVDLIRNSRGLWLIEVNPRYTASVEVLELATGANLLALHAAACEHAALPQQPIAPTQLFAGKQIIYAPQSVAVPPSLETLVIQFNRPQQPAGIADLPRIGDQIAAGQPVATVFATGSCADEVQHHLQARSAAVLNSLIPNC